MKPNNVVSMPCKRGIDFFKMWLLLLKPFHNLTDREMEVMAAFLEKRENLSKHISDEALLDNILMNEQSKREVRESCDMTLQHFLVIMSKIRRNNVIVNDRINPKLIPNIRHDEKSFSLVFEFDIKDEDRAGNKE